MLDIGRLTTSEVDLLKKEEIFDWPNILSKVSKTFLEFKIEDKQRPADWDVNIAHVYISRHIFIGQCA